MARHFVLLRFCIARNSNSFYGDGHSKCCASTESVRGNGVDLCCMETFRVQQIHYGVAVDIGGNIYNTGITSSSLDGNTSEGDNNVFSVNTMQTVSNNIQHL
jgi:hypothetical protein